MQSKKPETDYDAIMRGNAVRVFSELDPERRLSAMSELWASDATLYEQTALSGHLQISESIGALLRTLPPDTVFTPTGKAIGHHGVAVLRWAAGVRGQKPGPVTGTDVAQIQNGLIHKLHVFLDPPA